MVSSGYRRPDGDFDGLVFGDVAESFASAGAAAAAASATGWRVFHRSAAQQPLDLCASIETREKEFPPMLIREREMEKIDDMFFYLYTSAGHVRIWWLTQSRRKKKSKFSATQIILKSD